MLPELVAKFNKKSLGASDRPRLDARKRSGGMLAAQAAIRRLPICSKRSSLDVSAILIVRSRSDPILELK
jgi:hypothetical protein